MAQTQLKHAVVSCLPKDVEDQIEAFASEYDLVAMTAYQVGAGFGARTEVLLAFKPRAEERYEAGNGLPAGRQRRSPMAAIR